MDRFFRGLIGGIVGGVVMNIWSYISYYLLNLTKSRFVDWASVILYGRLPHNLWELSFALVAQLLWVGFLGVIFAYLIPQVTSRGYLVKGAFWGFITGFIVYGAAVALRLPHMSENSLSTAVSNFIGGILWGLTMAQVLRWLDATPGEKERIKH